MFDYSIASLVRVISSISTAQQRQHIHVPYSDSDYRVACYLKYY